MTTKSDVYMVFYPGGRDSDLWWSGPFSTYAEAKDNLNRGDNNYGFIFKMKQVTDED
jgi:hypothetical protein